MRVFSALITSLFLIVGAAQADDVVLKNGNRLTGTIVKLADNKLVLKTDFADTVNIKWDAVASFTAEKPLILQTPAGKLEARELTRKDGDLIVATAAGPTQLAASQLVSLRSQEEQGTYERSLHPGLRQGWAGGANVGLALARGNSSTINLSTGMDLARSTLNDKISLYATSVYAKDDVKDTITANAIQGGLRYDRNLTKRVFAYGSGDFETNDLQKLDLRSILSGGLGWHAINTAKTTLNLLGGAAWTRESYGTGLTNNIFSPSIGEDFTRKLSANTVFKQRLFFFPYVTGVSAGDYRAAFDAGLSTKINRIIAWQTTVSDRYVSNPLPGTKKNDLLLSTGFALTLAGPK